jgi:HEAT repeat protein
LVDGDEDVSRAAAEALGQLGDARAVKPLIARLNDNYWNVRSAAAKALRAIGTPEALAALEAWRELRQ